MVCMRCSQMANDRRNTVELRPRTARPRLAAIAAATLLCCVGCTNQPSDDTSTAVMPSVAPPGPPVALPIAGSAAPSAPSTSMMPSTPAGMTAGASVTSGAGTGGQDQAGAASDPSMVDDSHDHCVNGELADARDGALTGEPDEWRASNGDIDLVLPKGVLDWMGERVWEESHDAWHNIRRCKGGVRIPGFPAGGAASMICSNTELIPEHQECTDAEDGYAFLVMHRHMMQALRGAFPQHQQLFAGFPKFPYDATDVPEQWRARWGTGWTSAILDTAKTLEDIEHKLDQFPSEGDLGKFIQCGGMASGASSIHGALHFKWVVNESPYSLGKQTVNIDNYMFWKLHGWIDTIWERYRTAKGLTDDEPKLVQALSDQCREMHTLGHVVVPGSSEPNTDPLPVEHGVFHEQVRPILEKTCSGCHGDQSPEAAMSLGGHISSADVVADLINVQSMHGGQFKRVVPGQPNQSWLYLKAAGLAAKAGCSGAACNTQVMPPTGAVTLTQAQLDTIRQWIADGAAVPTM